DYFGCAFSWVYILFSLSALRHNTRYIEANKFDLGIFLQLEYWIEKSMYSFDPIGASTLAPYLNDGVYSGNEYLYQFMRSINAEFFLLGGGKRAFRQLPKLLRRAVYFTDEFQSYLDHLNNEAKRYQCEVEDLDLDDDDKIYDIPW